MRIAFVMAYPVISASNGVMNQALCWKAALEKRDHCVVLVNPWEPCDWKSFDVIHLFMFTEYSADYIDYLSKVNPRLAISPILDPDYSILNFKMRTLLGLKKIHLSNRYSRLRESLPHIGQVYVRSDFEASYFTQGLKVSSSKIVKIPLAINQIEDDQKNYSKENFCFDACFLADDRKNVKRLIDAAEKFHFPLKLAGKLRNETEKKKVFGWLKNTKYVEYVGFLSSADLLAMYKKARVFALPSVNEGVGIVALEAAAYGCDVVITNIGGPKEYYKDLATCVDPYDVDAIGKAVQQFLKGKTFQPALKEYVKKEFSQEYIGELLENGYKRLCLE